MDWQRECRAHANLLDHSPFLQVNMFYYRLLPVMASSNSVRGNRKKLQIVGILDELQASLLGYKHKRASTRSFCLCTCVPIFLLRVSKGQAVDLHSPRYPAQGFSDRRDMARVYMCKCWCFLQMSKVIWTFDHKLGTHLLHRFLRALWSLQRGCCAQDYEWTVMEWTTCLHYWEWAHYCDKCLSWTTDIQLDPILLH